MLPFLFCQDGLRALLVSLRRVPALLAATRSGAVEVRAEKQVAYHASSALVVYVRTHVMLHLAALRRRVAATAEVEGSGAGSVGHEWGRPRGVCVLASMPWSWSWFCPAIMCVHTVQ